MSTPLKLLALLLVFSLFSFAQVSVTVNVIPGQSFVEQSTSPASPVLAGEPVAFYCDYYSQASGARIQNADCALVLDGKSFDVSGERNSVVLGNVKSGLHYWKCVCSAPSYNPASGEQQLLSVETLSAPSSALASKLIKNAEAELTAKKEAGEDASGVENQLSQAVAAFGKNDFAQASQLAVASLSAKPLKLTTANSASLTGVIPTEYMVVLVSALLGIITVAIITTIALLKK
ncbi:hypothetical protein HY992_06240 [Candidatus Micrarchaeota archaeon]|nr:hypothetical protein [Candidatus Micrarchaeota archaeon]